MKTINISITESDIDKFGLQSERYTFSELFDIISREITRQRLEQSRELAEKYGISDMTMDDITREVQVVRQDAKNNF
jgi:hypothetical protein